MSSTTTTATRPIIWQQVIINALRYALAMVFIFSAFVKATDPMGTVIKLEEYIGAFGIQGFDTPRLLRWCAMGLCLVEFLPAICLLFGIHRRKALMTMLVFVSIMLPVTFYLALANPISDCGCFGDAVKLTNWQTFFKNIVLLAMIVPVLINQEMITRLISEQVQWTIVCFAFVSLLLYMQWNLRHLPAIDFRPYRIGADIRAGMETPDDAPAPVYETLFTLEKDGVTEEFSADDYPYADSTWHFVGSRTRLIDAGYVPPIQNFELIDVETGDDLTDDILDAPYALLLVMPQLRDRGNTDILSDLYDYAQMYDYPFYALTSAGEGDIERWRNETGAIYPFCQLDETVLQTINRSHTGLVLLREGVVVNKWSSNDLPTDEMLDDELSALPWAEKDASAVHHRYAAIAVWMFFPYLFLGLLAFFGERIWRAKHPGGEVRQSLIEKQKAKHQAEREERRKTK